MKITDVLLHNESLFNMSGDINNKLLSVEKKMPITFNTFNANEEKTVGIFTPLLSGNGIQGYCEFHFTSNARWQMTIRVYENDNNTPIVENTSEAPSGSGNGVWDLTPRFNVKAFNDYKITVSFNRSSSLLTTGTNECHINYYICLNDNFSIIKNV